MQVGYAQVKDPFLSRKKVGIVGRVVVFAVRFWLQEFPRQWRASA